MRKPVFYTVHTYARVINCNKNSAMLSFFFFAKQEHERFYGIKRRRRSKEEVTFREGKAGSLVAREVARVGSENPRWFHGGAMSSTN